MLLRCAPLLLAAALAACKYPQPCPTPLEECDGQCVDVQTNRSHCGGCGVACDVGQGQICRSARCILDPRGPCPTRQGGAFVTFGECGQSVKAWITDPSFVSSAASYAGVSPLPATPVLQVLVGTDCDVQWSWQVNDATAVFQPSPPAGCAACPSDVQADVAAHALWCPGAVLAVDPVP